VLAGGIDVVYPPKNAELQRAIGERGLLISERSPGFSPRAKDFPRRNRLELRSASSWSRPPSAQAP
jgi:DNA processing protein